MSGIVTQDGVYYTVKKGWIVDVRPQLEHGSLNEEGVVLARGVHKSKSVIRDV